MPSKLRSPNSSAANKDLPRLAMQEIPGASVPDVKTRSWRVIHACSSVRLVAELVEAQIAAGMRPFVLTGENNPQPASLMEAWHEVRNWRKYLEGCDVSELNQPGILHAHAFASAMAGVRGGFTVVYDVTTCVEDFSIAVGQCSEKSWLARSFRAAEEFVLARASAVAVHSTSVKQTCLERGVGHEDIFLVHPPVTLPPYHDTDWLVRAFDFQSEVVTIFARPNPSEGEVLIAAFAQALGEVPLTRLFIAAEGEYARQLRQCAQAHEVEDAVFFLSPADELPALQSADIVIAGFPAHPENSALGRVAAAEAASTGSAYQAMIYGRSLLAADCSLHRDLTPDGRGCLWFGSNEHGPDAAAQKDKSRDLAHRIAFLARNSDFRRALGENARRHLAETRNPERVGKMYNQVYLHADARRRKGDDSPGFTPALIPSGAKI